MATGGSIDASVAVSTNYLELTFQRAISIWWALMWRGILMGIGSGFVIGFIEGMILGAMGVSLVIIPRITAISGAIVGIPVGIFVVQLALRKRYREFSIRLVAN
jgi:hypothetical protein